MSFQYVSSTHKSSAVTHSTAGAFTEPGALNLITAYCTRVTVQTVGPTGLQPIVDAPINGRIAVMELFRPRGAAKDLLFLCTEANEVAVLDFDKATGDIVTLASGNLSSRVGQPPDLGIRGAIDPLGRAIALYLYVGVIKIVPLAADGTLLDAFDVCIPDPEILDVVFLHNTQESTLCVIANEFEQRSVKTYILQIAAKELGPGPWLQAEVDAGADRLVALPGPIGGVLVTGHDSLAVYNGRDFTIAKAPSAVSGYGAIGSDGRRHLLGDHEGNLSLLLIAAEGASVQAMHVEPLGRASIALTLTYLDDGVVFLGSSLGDSQLLRLETGPVSAAEHVDTLFTVLEVFPNIGPVLDCCLVDPDKHGQSQLVTCSGAFNDGAVCMIRNGIAVQELATLDLAGVQDVWPLKLSLDDEFHNLVAVSFVNVTAFLASDGESLEGVDIAGAVSDAASIYCGLVVNDMWIQVTERGVRLISTRTRQLVDAWEHPHKTPVSVCACNTRQLVVACGAQVFYFAVQSGRLNLIANTTLPHDVACVDITPAGGMPDATLCLAGLWSDVSIRALQFPLLVECAQVFLGGEMIPRSILYVELDAVPYVLCALGDGTLHTFIFTATPDGHVTFVPAKKIALGTQPVQLGTFAHEGSLRIFAACDRPTVVYSSNQKMLFSNVNNADVKRIRSFHTQAFPNSLAVVGADTLTIGSIDAIRRLQVKKMALKESPIRLAFHEQSTTVCVLTTLDTQHAGGGVLTRGFAKLLDGRTLELLHTYALATAEMPCSIVSCALGGGVIEYICVGTATSNEEEEEASLGRILVLRVEAQTLQLVQAISVTGGVYALAALHGGLVATVNSSVLVFAAPSADAAVDCVLAKTDAEYHGMVLGLYLSVRGDFILVGDVMRSVTVLVYNATSSSLVEAAADHNPVWLTAQTMLADDVYLGADNSYNLFMCKRSGDATSEEAASVLETPASFHLGEYVNVLRHGTLLSNKEVDAVTPQSSVMFCSQNGVVGSIVALSDDEYALLSQVQARMAAVVRAVGDFSHTAWRTFKSDRRTGPPGGVGFVDGDFVETFLDLPPPKMEEIVAGLKDGHGKELLVSDVTTLIDDMSRRH